MGNHTRNILMHDDDGRGIHVERDGKAIEFRNLNISPTDGNTCHTNGLMVILYSDFSGVRVRSVAVFLNGPDNLDTTFMGNLETIWNVRIIRIHT